MIDGRPLMGGIIAAGEGSRLRRDGWVMPKPLVPVAGVPLIAHVIQNFLAASVTRLRIIFNEDEHECVDWVRARFPRLDAEFIVKTTSSSLESFVEVTASDADQPLLLSTVDAWCAQSDFVGFVHAALCHPRDATVLAVTPLVADEKPLWIGIDSAGRVTSLGGDGGTLVTAGIYLVSGHVRRTPPPAGLGRLREYLTWLWKRGEPMYGAVIDTVVDVDRAEDVALAEALTSTARQS